MKIYSKAVKIWIAGAGCGFLFLLSRRFTGETIFAILSACSINKTSLIFLKNSIASLTTIFLGILLCFIELRIYKGVAPKTYAFLESLTSPLYKMLGKFDPRFNTAAPFFRSCLFYLLFVPVLAMYVNGFVFGFLVFKYSMLYPYMLLEVPAVFASAFLGFYILEHLESAITEGNLNALEKRTSEVITARLIFAVVLIQVVLLLASFLETRY